MILYIINHSPFSQGVNPDLFALVSPQDSILLLQDAVYGIKDEDYVQQLASCCRSLYYLAEDAQVRGIDANNEQLTPVDYARFVELSLHADQVITW